MNITREEYLAAVAESRLAELLNRIEVKKGDVFYIPAGTVHALGAGIEVVEVQQTSDVTYRIYDWDRVDASGKNLTQIFKIISKTIFMRNTINHFCIFLSIHIFSP